MKTLKESLAEYQLRSADEILQAAEDFFMQTGKVYETLKRLVRDLEAEQIPFVIVGGMALNLWGYTRETTDVDILLTPEGLRQWHEKLVGRGYTLAFADAAKSFRSAQTGVKIEVLTTGEYPGDGKPKPVAFPNPAEVSVSRDGYSVISLDKLIELKLASGLSAAHRLRDLADVQDLIIHLRLPRELAEALDASVRTEYVRLWEAAQGAEAE